MIKDIKIGQILINDFEVIDILGGGNGQVYVCCSKSNGYVLAFKTFQDDFLEDPDKNINQIIHKFSKEALPCSDLKRCPNIVFSSTEIIDERPFIVMEYIPKINGKSTLADYLNDNVSEKILLDWAIQFCYGMIYAYNRGIEVHGDIKPNNILINPNNILKIADFGLIQLSNENVFSKFFKSDFESDSIYGTPCYVAPEVFNRDYGVSNDIYSFGIVLYQMFSHGKYPYDIENCELKYAEDFRLLHQNFPVIPLESDIFPIISKCLEKEPKNRYNNFKELKKDLEFYFEKKFSERTYNPKLIDLGPLYYLFEAHHMADFNHIVESIVIFEELIDKYPNYFLGRLRYGTRLINFGMNDKSILHLSKAIKLFKNKNNQISIEDGSRAYYNLGRAYQNKNFLFDAIDNYNKAININPNCKEAYNNLANMYMNFDLNKSEEILKISIKKFPNFFQALINLGILKSKQKDYNNSEKFFLKAEEINEKLANYFWGMNYARIGRLTESIEKLDKCLKSDSYCKPAYENIIRIYLQQKNIESAKIQTKKLLDIYPLDDNLKIEIGIIYFVNNYPNEAIKIFDKIIDSNSLLKIDALIEKGNTLTKLNNSEALNNYDWAINLTNNYEILSKIWFCKTLYYIKIHQVFFENYCFKKYLHFIKLCYTFY